MPLTISLLAALAAASGPKPAAAGAPAATTVRFVGGAKKGPIAGLKLSVREHRGHYTDDKRRKPVATGVTGADGRASFALAPGRYYVDIESPKELPYLSLPAGYKGLTSLYDRTIQVGAERSFEFELAPACRLTLRAVDADTGKPMAGVVFVTESETAEQWGIAIVGDNLGAPRENDETQKTDAEGRFTRLLGPREGYTYFAWPPPEGYVQLGKAVVTLPTPVGGEPVEHVFRFRKKK